MAEFYGTLKGNRQTVTRTGSKASGIKASVQSWKGSVITELIERDGDLFIDVEVSDTSAAFGRCIFFGTVEEFKNKLLG